MAFLAFAFFLAGALAVGDVAAAGAVAAAGVAATAGVASLAAAGADAWANAPVANKPAIKVAKILFIFGSLSKRLMASKWKEACLRRPRHTIR